MKAIGYIQLSREFLNWRWYTNPNTMRVYLHLLMTANFCDAEFETHTIKRGQVITGRKALSAQLKLSERQVRTALEHLKTTNDIAIESTSKYSIITILNYERFASATNKMSYEQPTNGHQPTTNRPQYNKFNNKNKYNKSINYDVTEMSDVARALEAKSLFKD